MLLVILDVLGIWKLRILAYNKVVHPGIHTAMRNKFLHATSEKQHVREDLGRIPTATDWLSENPTKTVDL